MSTELHSLGNTTRPVKAAKRVGRGQGSKLGKTCGRGQKGSGARAGYKRRWGKEGGNMPLFMKLPIRGFSNTPFRREFDEVNLDLLEANFQQGDEVNRTILLKRGLISGRSRGVKLLGRGELKKKLRIHVEAISKSARDKLIQEKIDCQVAGKPA